ncbi:MAG: glycosyltransferase family 2 protein, partial [Thermodesulfobacteriota bacterium]
TDSTLEILKRYEGNLKWVSEKDLGQTDALIKGFSMATGKILAWINSDDIYIKGAIKKVAEFFTENPDVALLYGKSHYIDETGKNIGEYPTEEFDMKKLPYFNFICQPSVFFRKSVYKTSGGLDRTLSYTMDYDLWIRIAEKERVAYLPEFLSSYRLHEESKTVSESHTLGRTREALETARKLFGWAQPNRVYVYSYSLIKNALPSFLAKISIITTPLALLYSIFLYLILNKGIKAADLKTINIENIFKMFSWRN